MRLIGLLVTLAVLGYTTYIYLGTSNTTSSNAIQTKPVEYIDQTNQSVDAINDALQKQKDKLNKAN